LLQRRHIRVEQSKYISKKSNSLEEVESGTIYSAQNVNTEYPDPRRDEWQTIILPVLKKLPVPLHMKLSRKSRSMLTRNVGQHQSATSEKSATAQVNPPQTRSYLEASSCQRLCGNRVLGTTTTTILK
jgi:hypothetical protein